MNNLIKRVWTRKELVFVEDLRGMAFTQEDGAHTFSIAGKDENGADLALSGTVAGSLIRPDGTTTGMTGTISDGCANLTLSPECYGVSGRASLTIFLTSGGQKTAIYHAVMSIGKSSTSQVSPGVAADVVDLVNRIDTATASIPATYTALLGSIASDYDSSKTYKTGEHVWYGGYLYKAKQDIDTAESWTSGHWTKVVLADDFRSEITSLKSAINELDDESDLRHEQVLGYIKDIANIDLPYAEYSKDSQDMIVEIGKKITSGVVSSNSSCSYIAYTVPNDGYCYCVASPTDSGAYLYSGEPLGLSTYIKGYSKTSGFFPTINSPWEVKAGQIIAVSAKTTSASQLIYLADFGNATSKSGIKVENLENGTYPINQNIPFVIGRWGADGTHTSTVCARNKEATVFDHDTVAICALGYKFYNIIDYTDAWHQAKTDVCTYVFKANIQYRINITKLDETTISDANEVASHVMLYDVITSDYYKYQRTFFGLEMYNKIAIVGDSYSMKRSTYNNCWGQIVGQKLGIEVNLFGHSGYTTNTFRTAVGSNNSLAGLLSASANDLYWLGFGINDSAAAKQNPSYIGSVDDLTGSYTDYPNTLWGNYGCIIESIRATFPSAKIVLCNVMYHDMYTMQVVKDTTNIPLVNSALTEIAEHYQIPLINLMDDIFYRSPEYDNNMQATAYTHPDPILFPGMANANMRLFAKTVSDNPAYFKTSTAGD